MSKKSRANKAATTNAAPVTQVESQVTSDTLPASGGVDTIVGGSGGDATVEVVVQGKKKRVPMARVFIGDAKDGVIAKITKSVDSVKTYVSLFMNLPVGSRKGYDNYWAKEDGFTNPESIMKLTPQGIGKLMAICQHRAALYIADGGDVAIEMQDVIAGITAYGSIAVPEAIKVAQDKAINDALATLTKACGGNETLARQRLAQLFPQSSVAATEPTLAQSGGSITDDSDTAPEGEREESSVGAEA